MQFTVIDTQTGAKPNEEQIALTEPWAHDLIYCDMNGFALQEDGTLILLDECGNYRYCPAGRFTVTIESESKGGPTT